ncbi:MAG: SRPBCC family protein [Solirubrobacteraceae bacterium]
MITSVHADYGNLTITVIADFDAPIERVWELWSDPRKLERWWGPPAYPTTFETYELTPGGEATYVMTGPNGAMRGTWRVATVDPPRSLEFTDAFAGPNGRPIADLPVKVAVGLTECETGTRMEMHLAFESREDMEKLMSTGIVEGLRRALGQIDALLA